MSDNANGNGREKYLSAKELAAALCEMGLKNSDERVLAMMKAGAKRIGTSARLSDILAFLEAHPDFRPRSRRKNAGRVTVL